MEMHVSAGFTIVTFVYLALPLFYKDTNKSSMFSVIILSPPAAPAMSPNKS